VRRRSGEPLIEALGEWGLDDAVRLQRDLGDSGKTGILAVLGLVGRAWGREQPQGSIMLVVGWTGAGDTHMGREVEMLGFVRWIKDAEEGMPAAGYIDCGKD
jgi:hypothetical protein